MKRTILILSLAAFVCACSSGSAGRLDGTYPGDTPPEVPGLTFVKVPTTLFTFNETPEGRLMDGASVSFEVIQSAFWISDRPVDPDLYGQYAGKPLRGGYSYDKANRLLDAIATRTGLPVILPTEAMFEAAANAGAITPYSRFRYIVSDGWESERKDILLKTDYAVPQTGDLITTRSLTERRSVERYRSKDNQRFFIALRCGEAVPDSLLRLTDYTIPDTPEPSDAMEETIPVGRTSVTLVPVEGGDALLGGTPEQGRYAQDDEQPVRQVHLQDYKIATTEVTCRLWKEVMGTLPAGNSDLYPKRPVSNVSWYDVQEFILRLRSLTGRPFRLPSEDEWEYAARGGRKTAGYIFSGSNSAQEVAVCTHKNKDGESVRPAPADVGSRLPNELGLHDMSGSVWEWVRGEHPDGGAIQKGGSRLSLNTACRVSNRQAMDPGAKKDTFGFRLAL